MLGIYNTSDGCPFSVRVSIVCLLFCVSINIPMHIHKRAFNILIAMENMYWLRESHIAYSLKNIIVGWKQICLYVYVNV